MKIEILFPEICNLFGDMGNIKYLKKWKERKFNSIGNDCPPPDFRIIIFNTVFQFRK